MTTALEIMEFRKRMMADPKNMEARRSFHENFEWLEGYWRSQYGENYFDRVWKRCGEYFWQNTSQVQQIAMALAKLPPVGNNKNPDYAPSEEIIQATKLLQVLDKSPQLHFRAIMLIVWQIRNNLFHGKKMDIVDDKQYQRNKELVIMARNFTDAILEKLVEAEGNCSS